MADHESDQPADPGVIPASACPGCGGTGSVPILFGMPARASFEAAKRGELVLGGCVVSDGAPTRACPDCGHRW